MGRIHLATQYPIRMGAISGVQQYFRGRVTCLQIYGMALNANQIQAIKKKCAARDRKWHLVIQSLQKRLVFNFVLFSYATHYNISEKDPCLASPCKNGGSCIVDAKNKRGYRCRCRPGYHGHRCEGNNLICEFLSFFFFICFLCFWRFVIIISRITIAIIIVITISVNLTSCS